MAALLWGDKPLTWNTGETLLEALERQRIPVASSCRAGACHACLMKCVKGEAPAEAQRGLKESWRRRGLFLACQAREPRDLAVNAPDASVNVAVTLADKVKLAADVLGLYWRTEADTDQGAFDYLPGQYVSLMRPDGLTRSYSLASLPSDGRLEMHVRLLAGGAMSATLASALEVGAQWRIRGPFGDCHYVPGHRNAPLLLLAAGTGLAPLLGILRDALSQGHAGPVFLFHGGANAEAWYRDAWLKELASRHAQLDYRTWLLSSGGGTGKSGEKPAPVWQGWASELAINWDKCHVYACGNPGFVREAMRWGRQIGLREDQLSHDAFLSAPGNSLLTRGGAGA